MDITPLNYDQEVVTKFKMLNLSLYSIPFVFSLEVHIKLSSVTHFNLSDTDLLGLFLCRLFNKKKIDEPPAVPHKDYVNTQQNHHGKSSTRNILYIHVPQHFRTTLSPLNSLEISQRRFSVLFLHSLSALRRF